MRIVGLDVCDLERGRLTGFVIPAKDGRLRLPCLAEPVVGRAVGALCEIAVADELLPPGPRWARLLVGLAAVTLASLSLIEPATTRAAGLNR